MAERKPAAVILGIISTAPHGVIFVERAAHLRAHPGQIGLPGGRMDAVDGGDLRKAALREMHEEVGVSEDRVEIVWEFPPLEPRVSNFLVTPFVAIVQPGEMRTDAAEIAGAFTVPLETLLRDVREGSVAVGSFNVASTLLDYEGRRIWGLTGKILRNFIDAWGAAPALRDAVTSRLR